MDFTMLSCLKVYKKPLVLILLIISTSESPGSDEFSAQIKHVEIEYAHNIISLNADIEYRLSPTAKEALLKGIPLEWQLSIEVRQAGFFWDKTVTEIETSYQIQSHALMNLFSVKEIDNGSKNIFSSLTAALDSISKIRKLSVINKQSMLPEKNYQLAIKVLFIREALPVPLRPMSYFNNQWALSSPWSLWQLQN